MVEKVFNVLIGILSFLFWAFMLFGFNAPYIAILTVICAVIHEGGHLIALILTGGYTGLPRFVLSGFRLRSRCFISYKAELFVLLAGPLANILSFIFMYALSFIFGRYFFVFALLNLMTAISNLIPVENYDGYKIIGTLIEMHGFTERSVKLLRAVSFSLICILTFLSLYFIMTVGEGYWVFGIFFVSLLSAMLGSKNVKK